MQLDYDAIIVGAGFGGIYQLQQLLARGLRVKVIDQAGDVGGTWYWNRYPGAMSDTESYLYRFSWDKEDLRQYHWQDHYVKQPEVLAYLRHVVDRHGLREHMQFDTQLVSADFDEDRLVWKVATSSSSGDKETFTARYLITALGLLSKQNYPNIPGLDTFAGELYHTGQWPQTGVSLEGKRVGVIGNGSTGVQVITAIAGQVAHLVSFQRHPQYSVPSGDGPVSADYRNKINDDYDAIWRQVRDSAVGFGFEESTTPAMSVSPSERERVFQRAWDRGNGFRFMFGTFSDLTTDEAANEAACAFIRSKIADIVTDPVKARRLTPTDRYARRPLCDAGYYQQFNRSNVDVVDLVATPIERITSTGILTSDNTHHDLDVLILATGFDAVDGNYTRVAIRGRSGRSLADHWSTKSGPTTYLGMFVAGFPNLAMLTGPNGPFCNIPPALEVQVEFVTDLVARAECSLDWPTGSGSGDGGGGDRLRLQRTNSIGSRPVFEVTARAEDEWTTVCDEASRASLFRRTPSWIFGANVEGKRFSSLFYFGGLREYRNWLRRVVDEGYKGFVPF